MKKDPGLLTDSTGDGMAGAIDVSFETQQNYKKTLYNGSSTCKACGYQATPFEMLHTGGECPTCLRRKQSNRVKGRMA